MVVPVKIRSEVKSKMLMAVYDFYRLVLDVDSFMFRRLFCDEVIIFFLFLHCRIVRAMTVPSFLLPRPHSEVA